MSVAFVFPGQGSQTVGMLGELANRYSVIEDTFAIVSERLGYDVWHLVQQGPQTILNQTEQTQVAMLTADVALYRLLEQRGVSRPAVMAGHSLGEYAALVAADALHLADAAALVAKRGQLMQHAVPLGQGAMAAVVGLTDADVLALCQEVSTDNEEVTPANYNAVGQVVIAGHTAAVSRAMALAEERDARMAVLLPVSVPCHCALLKGAAEAFADDLNRTAFQIPAVPVISNVTLDVYSSVDGMRLLLAQQLYSPVSWVETIQMMKGMGVSRMVECGPGKVLSGLLKRIDKTISVVSASDATSLETLF